MGRGWLYLLLGVVLASPATAVPITYGFDSGGAHITVTRTGDNSLVADFDVTLNGAFVEFDTTGGTLDDLLITMGTSPPITLLQIWGGFDTFVIESASISPGTGYSSIFSSMTGPTTFAFLAGPLDIDGFYSASLSTGPPPAPVTNIPVPFSTPPPLLNGTIDTDTIFFELIGVTLAQLPGSSFGELDDLVVKADLTWVGIVVPEPSTGMLFAAGFGWLATRRKSSRKI